jgi:hypothetical protein
MESNAAIRIEDDALVGLARMQTQKSFQTGEHRIVGELVARSTGAGLFITAAGLVVSVRRSV